MARPYAKEMAELPETLAWALEVDIKDLGKAIKVAGQGPLRAIGSGGSLTAAHALAFLHQRFTGQLASVATPLEVVAEPLNGKISHWLLSAGGSNVDVLAASRHLVAKEPRQLCIVCGRGNSPLAEVGRSHPYSDLLIFERPAGKDGFLATNSLLAFTVLLARAYASEFGSPTDWGEATAVFRNALHFANSKEQPWKAALAPIWLRPTTLILYGPAARVGAIDLESKFTEAALGHVQIADYRNFAHGRHHWLAKHSHTSAVIALVTSADRHLAERTLALLPADVPQTRLDIAGEKEVAAVTSLIAAMKICEWAGSARGIDPGRPGVPDFGRKLYNLPLPRTISPTGSTGLSPREAAAIERKAGCSLHQLEVSNELVKWHDALMTFRNTLVRARFGAIVLDYDGTVVDTRDRFNPPSKELIAEFIRLASAGVTIAIATGRGPSVRRDLQKALPVNIWTSIQVGYYNGAEIAPLADNSVPDNVAPPCDELKPLAAALRRQPELAACADQTDRKYQITLEATRPLPEERLWDLAQQTMLATDLGHLCVTRSSHSIDIVSSHVSKSNVVEQLETVCGPVLAIGDRGRWPGNDYLLLRQPFSLGVDEISVDPRTCWNLGEPGQRGPTTTLEYLRGLEIAEGFVSFREGCLG